MKTTAYILTFLSAASCGEYDTQSPVKDLATPQTSNARSLFKELATEGTSDARRDELVDELSASPFAEVGRLAVQTMWGENENSISSAIWYPPAVAKTDKPWMEEQYSEEEKIRFAAAAIWHECFRGTEPNLAARQLAEWSAQPGSVRERSTYLFELGYEIGFDRYRPEVKPVLERIARDREQPAEIAVMAATILVRKADANAYLRVLIEACDRIEKPHARLELFRNATERLLARLSESNRKLFVRYGFTQLAEIDDGNSGSRYSLATELGEIVGVRPIRGTQDPFEPDHHLPQYRGKHGLLLEEPFFQDTVNNARAWWRENQKDYAE